MRRLAPVTLVLCAGCASYDAPGGPAPLGALAAGVAPAHELVQPAPGVPVRVSHVRIQAADYESLTAQPVAAGRFSVAPDAIDREALQPLLQWPLVAEAEPLRAALLPAELDSLDDLRLAAAKSLADVLLVYTVDTRFEAEGRSVEPLDDVPLGAEAGADARIISTASAVLVDVRTGYPYGTARGSARLVDIADAWSSASALDRRRLDAERQALAALVADAERLWNAVAGQSGFSRTDGASPTHAR